MLTDMEELNEDSDSCIKFDLLDILVDGDENSDSTYLLVDDGNDEENNNSTYRNKTYTTSLLNSDNGLTSYLSSNEHDEDLALNKQASTVGASIDETSSVMSGDNDSDAESVNAHPVTRTLRSRKNKEKKQKKLVVAITRQNEKVKNLSVGSDENNSVAESIHGQCMNHNAIKARAQRKKNKDKVESLEKELEELKAENKRLRLIQDKSSKEINLLKTEVDYLHGVISNQGVLSTLLQNIHQAPGVKFHSSFNVDNTNAENGNKENDANDDNDNNIPAVTLCKRMRRDCKGKGISPIKSPECKGKIETRQVKKRKSMADSSECADKIDSCKKKDVIPKIGPQAGICLHVSNGAVSLEFCSKCSNNSKSVLLADHSYGKPLSV